MEKVSIEKLNLSKRTRNYLVKCFGLKESDITIEMITKLKKLDLHLGPKTRQEIIEKVHKLGYRFVDDKELIEDKITIDDLYLHTRAYNSLIKYFNSKGIYDSDITIEMITEINLTEIPILGRTARQEIIEKVHMLGYKFANEPEGNVESRIIKKRITINEIQQIAFEKIKKMQELEEQIETLEQEKKQLSDELKTLIKQIENNNIKKTK